MDHTKKCAGCGADVPADAEKAGYIRTIESVVVDVVLYRLCARCVGVAKTEPRKVARAVRRTYEREGLN